MADQRPNRISLPALLLVLTSLSVPASATASQQPISAAAPDLSYADELVAKARASGLHEDPYWRILLHYRARTFGGWKSEIDAPAYFAAKHGRTDPAAELEATLRAFFVPSDKTFGDDADARCRYIDRFSWLKARLSIDSGRLPDRACPEYDDWRKALDPESVTIVFSSYYMNNPSSLFGHTLLRLNHKSHTESDRLLDYGVNYAATPTTTNAFLYGMMGLTGGFKGDFSNIPYYLKVLEYNDTESRDLWEYDLNLSAPQIDLLMKHLWAVGRVRISYYFLDRNCSYMLLTLLDAAEPSLAITDEFASSTWVIPADTIRKISERPGLVGKVRLRQSISARIRDQRSALSAEQRAKFYELVSVIDSEDDPADEDADNHPSVRAEKMSEIAALQASESGPILDLALDYLRLKKTAQKGKLEPAQSAFQRELLTSRAKIEHKPYERAITDEEIERARPDKGHETRRLSLGGGYNEELGAFGEIAVRAAFHDLAANPRGYPAQAQIELLPVHLRYYPRDSKVRVERADLIRILSLTPMDPLFKRMSWEARIGADPVRDILSDDSLELKGQVGGGASFTAAPGFVLYVMGRAELGWSSAFVPHYRLGPAAATGMQILATDWLAFVADASYSKPILGFTRGYYRGSAQARLTTSVNSELRLQYDLSETADQLKALLHVYF